MGNHDDREVISLASAAWPQALARHWRLLVLPAAVGAVLGFGYSFIRTPVYTARVTILPQRQSPRTDLLAEFAGVSGFPSRARAGQEELYARVVTSDRLLDRLIARRWTFRGRPGSSLYDVFDLPGPSGAPPQDALRAARLKRVLRQRVVTFTRERATGYMELSARVPRDPLLASALANTLSADLDEYNRESQRARANELRMFLESRLGQVAAELDVAETARTEFVLRNRAFASSPELTRLYHALSREVEAQTAVWIELRRQLEVAKIDERRDLQSLDVLDQAMPPTRRSAPSRVRHASGGAAAAILIVFALVALRSLRRARQSANR